MILFVFSWCLRGGGWVGVASRLRLGLSGWNVNVSHLLENPARRKNLATYLQNLTQRDATKEYPAKARLADFQSVFGDIARLEVEFLRYIDRM